MKRYYYLTFIILVLSALSVQAEDYISIGQTNSSMTELAQNNPLQEPLAGLLQETANDGFKSVSVLKGDVNGDGIIDISDATTLIDILLGSFANYDTMQRCDVDYDGSVSIKDVTELIDYLLGGELPVHIKEGYDYVWDDDTMPEIHLKVSLEEWNKLLQYYDENMYTRQYVMAKISFIKGNDTTVVDSVGLRLKGNSTRDRPEGYMNFVPHTSNSTSWRRVHFGVNLRKYVDEDAHTIQGIRKLYLRCCRVDPSYVREKFCYDLFKRAGIWTAIRDVYCRLWIHVEGDDNEAYFGVYQLLEPIDKRFLKDRKDKFGTSNGFLWKCCRASCGLNKVDADIWYDDDTDDRHAYTLKTQTADFDSAKVQLIDFITKLTTLTGDDFYNWINEVTDVDLLLRTYAINVALGSWDDYWNHANNFFMYFTTKGLTGYKFFFIPYDYDSTLGTCVSQGAQSDAGRQDPLNWGSPAKPLIYKIISFKEYRNLYIKYLKQAVDEQYALMDRESAQARINGWYQRISTFISNDTDFENVIMDTTAHYSAHPEYKLMTDDENNFFDVKAASISVLKPLE